MKTSNKLLLGAFIIFVIFMIVANVTLKNKVDEYKENGIITERVDTIAADTVEADSIQTAATDSVE
ncbi:MAG: hypothetical protein H6Q20_1480 [Bacteroidetes bacterium]|nr:hypothetical protein [Bacteroidota bacterium]